MMSTAIYQSVYFLWSLLIGFAIGIPHPKKNNLWYLQSFVSWACIDVTSLWDDKYLFASNVIFFEQIEPTITN